MTRPLPEYVRRTIDLKRAQAEHRRTAPKGCPCPTCAGPLTLRERLDRKLAEQRERVGEAPF